MHRIESELVIADTASIQDRLIHEEWHPSMYKSEPRPSALYLSPQSPPSCDDPQSQHHKNTQTQKAIKIKNDNNSNNNKIRRIQILKKWFYYRYELSLCYLGEDAEQ